MALSEVFVALQTGVMDGQENPFTQIHSSRLHEVQSYLSLTGHVYTPAYLTVGRNRWRKVPDDVRQVLSSTARGIQDYVYETATRMDDEILARLETAGMQVNEADRASFVRASEKVYREFADSVDGGRGLIDRARALTDPGGN